MRIDQLLTSYSYGDAIGNEALEIRNYLREHGYSSDIYAMHYHPKYASEIINYKEYQSASTSDNILIYHFSIGSPVTKTFIRSKGKKVIIYHNITPYEFFLDYHRFLARDCFKGRLELKRLVGDVDLALGDSLYNEQELKEAGFKNTGVVPLVMNFEKFKGKGLPLIKDIYGDNFKNIVYVGRIIPNKKIEDLIKVFYFYKNYFNNSSRLIIVGEYRGFERYLTSIYQLVEKLNLPDIVFTGHVTEDELISFFKIADIYMHMSEHEGFCAPIPEAFFLKKPVIAYSAAAIPETMNDGGLLIKEKNFIKIAGLIDKLLKNKDLYEKVIKRQSQTLDSYKRNVTGKKLLEELRRLNVKL